MQLILIVGIIIAIGAVIFALQNNTPVMVTLAFWSFEGSLALVLLVSLGLGALIAGLLSSPAVIRGQWTARRLRNQVTGLERQLAEQNQRTRDLDAELVRHAPPAASTVPATEKPYVGLRALLSGSEAEQAPPLAEVPSEQKRR